MSKKSKLDLLVRVRYVNPLPAPPFPPKLFDIPTNIGRLGEPSYLDHLASSAPIPMLVDSEMGMPIDLGAYEGVWHGDDTEVNPPAGADISRVTDPVDISLLAPFRPVVQTNGGGAVEALPSAREVSWMRNSGYSARKNNTRRRSAAEGLGKDEGAQVDVSEVAQIMAIDKTFTDLDAELASMRHPDPRKRHLRVVESYDVLPDEDRAGTSYIVIKYPERPSAASRANPHARATAHQLSRAVCKPVKTSEGETIIGYMLPDEEDIENLDQGFQDPMDEEAVERVVEMSTDESREAEAGQQYHLGTFTRTRVYEVLKQHQHPREILVTFQDQESQEGHEGEPSRKRKSVTYNPVFMRTTVRKRPRADDNDEDLADVWNKARAGFATPTEAEDTLRTQAGAPVIEPNWTNEEIRRLHGGDNMAEGQGEAIDDEEDPRDEGAEEAEEGA